MKWKTWGLRVGAIGLLWAVISLAAISEAFLRTVETNPVLLVVFWLVMLGSVIYFIAAGVWPFFRFILKNARSKEE